MQSRYITYGSAAYDFNTSRRIYAEPQTERHIPTREERHAKAEAARAARRAAAAERKRVVSMALSVALAAGMIVLNLLSYAMLAQISETTGTAQNEYTMLREEHAKLLVKYEQTFNMNEIEDYAINVLGMTRPTGKTKTVLGSVREDKSVVYSHEEKSSEGIISEITNLVSSLLSYLK